MSAAIKVGISASLSGQFQTQGRQALAGIRAWAEDANRAGGLTVAAGRGPLPVSVVCYDDASLADGTRRATRRLILDDRVDLLFGPYSSGLAQAAAAVAAEHNRLLWNHGGASDNIQRTGPGRVVDILTPAGEYLAALPDLVRAAAPGARTFAIVRCAVGAFPRQVSDGMARRAVALGFEQTLHHEFPPDTTDFSHVLDAVAQVKPDLLLAVGRIRHDLAFARQLARRRTAGVPAGELGVAGTLVTLGAVAVVAAPIRQFRDALGDNAAGFIGPSQWEPGDDLNDELNSEPSKGRDERGDGGDGGESASPVAALYGPAAAQVMASLQRAGQAAGDSTGDLAVDYPMVQAYAAGLVAQRCGAAAGTLDDTALWEAAAGLDFTTFYGRFRIDPDSGRQVGRSGVIIQWQQGRKAIIWPPEPRRAGLVYPWPV